MICGYEIDYILRVFLLEALQSWLFLAVPLVLLLLILTTLLPGYLVLRTGDFYTTRQLFFAVFLWSACLGGLSNWFADYLY